MFLTQKFRCTPPVDLEEPQDQTGGGTGGTKSPDSRIGFAIKMFKDPPGCLSVASCRLFNVFCLEMVAFPKHHVCRRPRVGRPRLGGFVVFGFVCACLLFVCCCFAFVF